MIVISDKPRGYLTISRRTKSGLVRSRLGPFSEGILWAYRPLALDVHVRGADGGRDGLISPACKACEVKSPLDRSRGEYFLSLGWPSAGSDLETAGNQSLFDRGNHTDGVQCIYIAHVGDAEYPSG